ncbi:MAG: maleylpyruvate isomerase family mycothiol-dependent enzyme [Nocardioides sp.]
MTALTDRSIAALRGLHDDLVAHVRTLAEAELSGPSAATDWTVAQVLSHLGSGAEIGRATYTAAIAAADPPGDEFNLGVWDRWNAMTPAQQAQGFIEADAELLTLLESVTAVQRDQLEVKLGFLPNPLPLESIVGMRLSEVSLHSWDVRAGRDLTASVDPTAASALLEHYAGGMGFLLGFIGRADQVAEQAVVALGDTGLSLVVGDGVRVTHEAGAPTATFAGPAEAAIRLLAGRLGPAYVGGVQVLGNLTLDDLRRVFPGY